MSLSSLFSFHHQPEAELFSHNCYQCARTVGAPFLNSPPLYMLTPVFWIQGGLGEASHKSPTLDPLQLFYILNTPFTLFESVSFLKQLIYLFKQGYLKRDLIMQPEIENLGN